MAHNQHFWIVHSINVSSDTSAFPFVDAEGSSHMKKQREGISGRNWPPVELDGRIQSLQLTYILRSLWCWATHFSSVLLTVQVFRSDYIENAFDWENVEIGSCSLYCIALRNSQRIYKKTSETKHSNPAIVVMSTIHGQAAVSICLLSVNQYSLAQIHLSARSWSPVHHRCELLCTRVHDSNEQDQRHIERSAAGGIFKDNATVHISSEDSVTKLKSPPHLEISTVKA